jgi:hypothetical protein
MWLYKEKPWAWKKKFLLRLAEDHNALERLQDNRYKIEESEFRRQLFIQTD